MDSEKIQMVANVIAIIGLIIAIVQLGINMRNANLDFKRRKMEATMLFTYEILSELDKLSPILKNRRPLSYKEYKEESRKIVKDNEEKSENKLLQESILQHLKLMERISVGLNTDIYDIDIFRRICGRRTCEQWYKFRPLVYEMRKNESRDNLYSEYEKLVVELERRKSSSKFSNGDIK